MRLPGDIDNGMSFDPNEGYDKVDGSKFGFIMGEVMAERARQEKLKGEGRFKFTCADSGMANLDRLACLDEECGEVARECLTLRGLVFDRPRHEQPTSEQIEALHRELVQVTAICVAWLESDLNSVPIL